MKANHSLDSSPEVIPLEPPARHHGDPHPAAARTTASPVRLQRILVPIDFSECSLKALDYAIVLAERFRARLILLHVIQPTAFPQRYLDAGPALEEANQVHLRSGRERLSALVRKRIGNRLPAEVLVRIGRAYSEIPDTARALGADIIVVGARGSTGPKPMLLGSTAERVVRHAPCAVLTIPPPR